MLPIAVAVIAGIVVAHFWKDVAQSPLFYIIASIIALAAVAADIWRKDPRPIMLALISAAGFSFAMITLDKESTNEKIPYDTTIRYVAQTIDHSTLRGKYVKTNAQLIQIKDSLQVWRAVQSKIELYVDTTLKISPKKGNILTFTGKLRHVDGSYGEWLADQGFLGKVYTYRVYTLDSAITPTTLVEQIAELREHTAAKIYAIDSLAPQASSIMSALTIGERGAIPRETTTQYRRAGVAHLLAVSGLHVGIMVVILNLMFGFVRMWRYGRICFSVAMILAMWAYAVFTGMSPSVLRAVVMFSMYQIGIMCYRTGAPINILASAALILMLIDPAYLFNVGFQLSFLAMAGITTLYKPICSLFTIKNRVLRSLWSVTVVTIAAQVAVMPLVAYYFGQIPLLGIVLNMVVWITVPAIIMGTILFLVSSLWVVGYVTLKVCEFQNSVIATTAAVPCSTIQDVHISLYTLIVCYAIEIALAIWITKATDKRLRRMVLGAKYNF